MSYNETTNNNMAMEKEVPMDMDLKELANSNKELLANETAAQQPPKQRSAKFLVYKNLLVVGLAWVFFFTAYQSIANLQSSLNSDGGLGTASLSTIYVSLIFSCIFLPTVMIKKLDVKWTIIVSQFAYILYIASNVYPRYYTLIPAAVILGLGAAPLWTAKCTFLTDLGTHYSKFTGETAEVVINRFFGIFFAMFQSSGIWGNIISATVLRPEEENGTQAFNLTSCAINDCPNNPSVSTKKPPMSTVYILCGIYIGCAFFAVLLIFLFLDSYKKIGLSRANPVERSPLESLVNTIKHLKHLNQILIIPLTLWSGFQQAFIGADFTRSYITCTKSVSFVGIIMLCYGAADTMGSYGFGYVIKYVGRIPCFLIAACLNFTAIGVMIFYIPTPENYWVLFIIAVLWGLGDAVWQTQINSFYGVIFIENAEAGFSNYRLWESLGFAIAYFYSNFICVRLKVYLLIVYLTSGIVGYALIEFRLKKAKAAQVDPTPVVDAAHSESF